MLCGGTSEIKPADENIQDIVNAVKGDFEGKANRQFADFTVVGYKSQVVAGTNHFVKVRTGDGQFAHLRIFVPLPHTNEGPQAVDIQLDKAEADELSYF